MEFTERELYLMGEAFSAGGRVVSDKKINCMDDWLDQNDVERNLLKEADQYES